MRQKPFLVRKTSKGIQLPWVEMSVRSGAQLCLLTPLKISTLPWRAKSQPFPSEMETANTGTPTSRRSAGKRGPALKLCSAELGSPSAPSTTPGQSHHERGGDCLSRPPRGCGVQTPAEGVGECALPGTRGGEKRTGSPSPRGGAGRARGGGAAGSRRVTLARTDPGSLRTGVRGASVTPGFPPLAACSAAFFSRSM